MLEDVDLPPEESIDRLANYIMEHVDGEPSRSEGAADTALRLIKRYRAALGGILRELRAQHSLDISVPATRAYNIADGALGRVSATEVFDGEG